MTETIRNNCTSEESRMGLANELNDALSSVLMPVTVFVGVEAVLGFLGNVLVLYIYIFRYHICNFKYFVITLAAIDLVSCLTTIPGEMVTQLYWYVYPWVMLCKVKSFFIAFTVGASTILLLMMALDRFLKVCRPHGRQIRPKLAFMLCFISLFAAFAIAFPVPILWGKRSYDKEYKGANITVTLCEKDQIFEKTHIPLEYSLSLQVILSTIMVVLACLYILIGRKLLCTSVNSETALNNDARISYMKTHQYEFSLATNRDSNRTSGESVETSEATLSKKDGTGISGESQNGDPTKSNNATIAGTTVAMVKETAENHTETLLKNRVKRKTLILFILTAVFIVTTILYLTLLSFIAREDDILDRLTDSGKATYFFFFRLYFVNHVINPILYGFLDPECREFIRGFGKCV